MGKPQIFKMSDKEDYVNNEDFVKAIVEYQKTQDDPDRELPPYIAECFLEIAEGLSKSYNFINYTFREDMVMDAVINFIKVVDNFDISASTRGGAPNAFGYFTQIAFFAFLRRIEKEKHQQRIKDKVIRTGNLGDYANFDTDANHGDSMVEKMRMKHENFFDPLKSTAAYDNAPIKKKRKKRVTKKKKNSSSNTLSE